MNTYEKILHLLYDYSKEGKVIDQQCMILITRFIIREKYLDNYVIDIEFEKGIDQNENILAKYFVMDRIIKIYLNQMNKYIEDLDGFFPNSSQFENIFIKNLMVTQTLLHELQHAKQYKIIDHINTMEANILKLGSYFIQELEIIKSFFEKPIEEQLKDEEFLLVQNKIDILNKNHQQNYEQAPEERQAEINSVQEVLDIIKPIRDEIPYVSSFMEIFKEENLLCGYQNSFIGEVSSPTVDYLSNSATIAGLGKLEWYDVDPIKCLEKASLQYSLKERLYYGMPISKEEYDKATTELNAKKKVKL